MAADVIDIPGGASGLLAKDYQWKEANRLMTRIDPALVSLVAELRSRERRAAEELGQWQTVVEEHSPRCLADGDHPRPAADRRGVGLVGE